MLLVVCHWESITGNLCMTIDNKKLLDSALCPFFPVANFNLSVSCHCNNHGYNNFTEFFESFYQIIELEGGFETSKYIYSSTV